MKNCIKAISAVIFLMFASHAWAQSAPLSLGYSESGNFEVDMIDNAGGSVSVYCNGELVFACDSVGVTTAASGIYWSWAGAGFSVSGAPSGNYTATLNAQGSSSNYTFSAGGNAVYWNTGYYYSTVEFIGW